ncbi:MAG: TetR family transcriptional regulator, partial [Proteobacteria bacterium]
MAAARYHHGDLARALVQEGVRAVEESGAAALQVKALAAALGVSHA